ncbi:TraM recognition domain-containing protein [Vibrio owensii]|uniref:TraM recognition domain-containing protein n=1 Tax=Vibrio owensii TaxID=696485 RepID=UPI003CC6A216
MANADLEPGLISRDVRPLKVRAREAVTESGGELTVGCGIIVGAAPIVGFSVFADLFFIFTLLFMLYSRNLKTEYLFRTPIKLDENGEEIKGCDGLILIGNSNADDRGVWFSNDDLRTHMLVFGSTGSGKTRFLLGILYQAMMIGSGAIYVDGKGDNTVWWLVFSFCRKIDRVDDLLVINYLAAEIEGEQPKPGTKQRPSLARKSNTSNPFAYGSSEQLRSLIVGLMRDGGGDDMWKGRSSAMMGALLKGLTYLRDIGEINLDIEQIRDHMPLDRIVEFTNRDDIKESAKASLKKYLLEIPGFTEDDAVMGNIQPKAYEQHGYLTMQMTEIMGDLSETYGHIFSAPLGEVDYKDVVFNRRVLFVLLPALEKDPDALAGLGKLVVSGVRSALAPALGGTLEGTKREVIDQKPTNCSVPFLLILDEYGYYSVKGFAVVAAQARSLGVGVLFAGQDYPSFKKGSEEEAASTVANTNIKICMKLEDPKDTLDIVQARAGDAVVSQSAGHENRDGKYVDQGSTRNETQKRINLRDLVNQRPGAAHVVHGDKLDRCQLYFADPHQVSKAKINKFVMVDKAKPSAIETINGTFKKLDEIWAAEEDESRKVDSDEGIKSLIGDMKNAFAKNESLSESALIAVGMNEIREELKGKLMSGEVEPTEPKAESPEDANKETKVDSVAKQASKPESSEKPESKPEVAPQVPTAEEELAQEEAEGILDAMDELNRPKMSVKDEAKSSENNFDELLTSTVVEKIEKESDTPLSNSDRQKVQPKDQLTAIEKMSGKSKEESEEAAQLSMDIISQKIVYPNEPKPKKAEQNEIAQRMEMIRTRISKAKLN